MFLVVRYNNENHTSDGDFSFEKLEPAKKFMEEDTAWLKPNQELELWFVNKYGDSTQIDLDFAGSKGEYVSFTMDWKCNKCQKFYNDETSTAYMPLDINADAIDDKELVICQNCYDELDEIKLD